MFTSAVTVALASVLLAAPPTAQYQLETAKGQRIRATLAYEISVPKARAEEWVLYAASAPELPCQSQVRSRLEPGGVESKETSDLQRPVLAARLPVKNAAHEKELSLQITYEATLFARRLVPAASAKKGKPVRPLSDQERSAALQPSTTYDFKQAEFRKWLDEQKLSRGSTESDVDFARRTFLSLRTKFGYEYKSTMDRRSSIVCRAGRSDCGGLSAVFVSAMRTNGIPARCLVGRWAMSSKQGEKLGDSLYHQWHVKAEFFANGVGWVPVDVSVGIGKDRTAQDSLRHFGNDRGDFLVQHIDHDLVLDSIHFGKSECGVLQVVSWWVKGTGTLDDVGIKEDWQVRKLP